jgi:hypothetical protein
VQLLAPDKEKDPARHVKQVALDVAPVAVLYSPAAQFVHDADDADREYFPDGQEVQTVAPEVEYAPAEHA